MVNYKYLTRFLFIFNLLLIGCLSGNSYSQPITFKNKEYQNRLTFSQKMDYFRDLNGLSLYYGYHQTNFLNSHFGNNLDEKVIKRKYGGAFRASQMVFPFIFDFDWFSSRFRVDSSKTVFHYSDSVNIRHRGVSFSVSAVLFPVTFTQLLIPYAGAGYQSSGVCIGCGSEYWFSSKKVDKSSVSTSGFYYKIGVLSILGPIDTPVFRLNVEYMRSFALDKKALNMLYLSLGVMITE
ncbi:MAG: hypothetical protein NTU44_05170 [Bacteroidetes bacterium]|nr:hypothetical protein [Bacteroidota bacterium]